MKCYSEVVGLAITFIFNYGFSLFPKCHINKHKLFKIRNESYSHMHTDAPLHPGLADPSRVEHFDLFHVSAGTNLYFQSALQFTKYF